MKIDNGKITSAQFMFAIACFVQSSSILTAFLAPVTQQDSWLSVVFGALICFPLIWLFYVLMRRFPEKNIIQILEEVYGRVAGKIIGVGYVWFFITLASINLMDMGEFSKLTLMRETPLIALCIICVLVAAIAVRGGVRLVTKYSFLFVVVATLITIFTVILTLNQFDLNNFLPAFQLPPIKYVQGTHIISTIPFGELVVFLMISPNVKFKEKSSPKYIFGGFLIGAITLLVVVFRDIAVLGNTLDMFTLPSLVTLQLVNFGSVLSRVEILFAVVLIMLVFFRFTFLFYAAVMALAQILGLKSYRHLVLAAGAFIVAYGLTLYPCPVEHAVSAQKIVPFLWMLFEILIPILTIIISVVRKKPKMLKEA